MFSTPSFKEPSSMNFVQQEANYINFSFLFSPFIIWFVFSTIIYLFSNVHCNAIIYFVFIVNVLEIH